MMTEICEALGKLSIENMFALCNDVDLPIEDLLRKRLRLLHNIKVSVSFNAASVLHT